MGLKELKEIRDAEQARLERKPTAREVDEAKERAHGKTPKARKTPPVATFVYSGFKTAKLFRDGQLTSPDGEGSIAGATAWVESAGDIDRRVTATRLLLTGPLAFGLRQKHDHRELYLTIEGPGISLVLTVNPLDGKKAREFAAKVNKTARGLDAAQVASARSGPSAAAPDLLDQLETLGRLRDSGVLTEDEFVAQKANLLSQSSVSDPAPPGPGMS